MQGWLYIIYSKARNGFDKSNKKVNQGFASHHPELTIPPKFDGFAATDNLVPLTTEDIIESQYFLVWSARSSTSSGKTSPKFLASDGSDVKLYNWAPCF